MNETHPLEICLFGCSLDNSNRGVVALARGSLFALLHAAPSARFYLLHGAKRSEERWVPFGSIRAHVDIVHFRLSPKTRPRHHLAYIVLHAAVSSLIFIPEVRRAFLDRVPWLAALRACHLACDIRGGDSFSDIYGVGPFLMGSVPALLALWIGKSLVLLPQTYGPFSNPICRAVAARIVRRARYVMARDLQSIEFLAELCPELETPVAFCPDVAFALQPDHSADVSVCIEQAADRGRPTVGVNVNGLLYNGGYTGANMFGLRYSYAEFVRRCLQQMLSELDVNVLLVPHVFGSASSPNNDLAACMKVRELVDDPRLKLVDREYDAGELKAIIGSVEFFVGSRMHSCIAAISQGVPAVGVAYSRKFAGVFESAGVGEMVIDARSTDMQETIETVLRRYEQREITRSRLRRVGGDLEAAVSRGIGEALQRVEGAAVRG